jgi:hypothetical protein
LHFQDIQAPDTHRTTTTRPRSSKHLSTTSTSLFLPFPLHSVIGIIIKLLLISLASIFMLFPLSVTLTFLFTTLYQNKSKQAIASFIRIITVWWYKWELTRFPLKEPWSLIWFISVELKIVTEWVFDFFYKNQRKTVKFFIFHWNSSDGGK